MYCEMKQIHPLFLSALIAIWLSPPLASADPPKPTKVFILAGQSNMEGQGIIAADPKRNGGQGSLEYLVQSPEFAQNFGHLKTADGKWALRNDVWISYLDRSGPLTVGYGAKPDRIGPGFRLGAWQVT